MKYINIEGKIVDLKSYLIAQKEGLKSIFFTTNNLNEVLSSENKDTDLTLRINCEGGFVNDALQMYDMLRTSGKNITANIENGCHSSGILLLLSAPKEQRTANYNATALIHEPRMSLVDSTSEELRKQAEYLDKVKNNLLDIYVERTGTDRVILEQLMSEEKERTAQELLKYGFIGKINNYNTNLKLNQMAEMTKEVKELLGTTESFIAKIKNFFVPQVTNYAFVDHEGNTLFTTEKQDESIAVGDKATPDGTFEVNNQIVIIENGEITSIEPIDSGDDSEAMNALKAENETLKNELSALKESNTALNEKIDNVISNLKESETVITNLSAQIKSTFVVPQKVVTPKVTNQTATKSVQELKEEAKSRNQKQVKTT